ncbi:hypothetical protein [Mycoplasma suis]|nr:hypothetical protein [Mycoplasma suis]
MKKAICKEKFWNAEEIIQGSNIKILSSEEYEFFNEKMQKYTKE